jgi:tetratricopeptide (TPR) repeat protein
MLRDTPVLGAGAGRYQVVYPRYRNPEIIRMFGQHSYMTDHPENLTLEIAADLGVIGLGLWAWLWWMAAARVWRRLAGPDAADRRLAAATLASLAGLLATNSVGVDVHYGATAFLGAVLTGIALRQPAGRQDSTSDDVPRAGGPDAPPRPLPRESASASYRLFSGLGSVLLLLVWSRLYHSDAALARALAASSAASWDAAHAWYGRAIRVRPGNVMARYFGASAILDSRGDAHLPEAEALLDSVRREAPEYVLLNYKYWLLYNRAGREADARSAFARQIALDPHAAAFHLESGRRAMDRKRWEDAERDFEAAANAEPDNPAGHQYLGNLRVLRGRYRDALAAYDRGLARRPDSVELHYNAAVAAFKMNDRALARRYADAVLRLAPAHAQARLILAKLR